MQTVMTTAAKHRPTWCCMGSLWMVHPVFSIRFFLPVWLAMACLCLSANAAPYVPKNPDDVVQTLPERLLSSNDRRGERQARERLKRNPAQLPLALQLARASMDQARRWGDPRQLGQAQAALAPWWSLADPPPAVRLLRASIRQSQHEFDAALKDLDALVLPQPASPTTSSDQPFVPLVVQAQAELTRAAVLQVQGHLKEAEIGCRRLSGDRYASLGNAVHLPAQACMAELASLQGQAEPAERELAALAGSSRQGMNASADWLGVMRAELAERQGNDKAAASIYKEVIQSQQQARADSGDSPTADVYPLAAYADWLLAHGQEADAAALLNGREDADALLLRLAIALHRLQDPKANRVVALLGARFEATAQRGDLSHRREQALFELELKNSPAAALPHAQANWLVQKEPADLLLLLRAAQAAHQPQAAGPAWRWIRETGYEDVRLKAFSLAASGSQSRGAL